MGSRLGLAVCAWVLTGACSTVHEELPSQSETSQVLADASLIPDAPTPTPTPTPDLTAPPGYPGGGVAGGNEGSAMSCGEPAPPSISRVRIGVLHTQPGRRVLNSTPLVGPDGAYCRSIGFTDSRLFCPVRPNGHPERQACEALQVGRATDTGRVGPTWTAEERPCRGRTGGASCQNHPDNQFLVIAYGAGTFEACTANGTCGRYVAP
jgi:hypothetical protein